MDGLSDSSGSGTEAEVHGSGETGAAINWDHFILERKSTTRQFIENVLENIIESIVVTDLAGRLIYFNKYSEEMFGYSAPEVLDRHIATLGAIEPDVIGHVRRNLPFNGEVALRRKNGTRFPAQVRCVPLRDEGGSPMAMVGLATDLTREKEKEQIADEIAKLKAFNENLISSLNEGIQLINSQGIITFVNQRIEDLFGYSAGELVGRHYSELPASEGVNHLRELTKAGGKAKGLTIFETTWTTRKGKKLSTIVSASPMREGDRVVGVVLAVTDISEMRQLKQELYQSEKMSLVGTMASELAHEINNPLAGLTVAVQMLIKELKSGRFDHKAFLEELGDMEKDAKRCRNITRHLLDFSRSMPVDRSMIDLNHVVEEALFLVQRQAELENITFIKTYADDLPQIRGNLNSLQQVIINLVKNACDAMPDGGELRLKTALQEDENGPWLKASVADTGPGISPDIEQNLFSPFLTTKSKGKGTGLGLAVSKRIVEEFGGRISFRNLERGVEFSVFFPVPKQDSGL